MRKVRISKVILMTGAGLALTAGAAGLALARADTAPHQVVTGPTAEYWISTSTSSGMNMAAMAGGGGARPSMAQMMDMMKGGVNHTMRLQLGSTQAASGDPNADHLPPAVLDAGNDLPLYYKAAVAQQVASTGGGDGPQQPSRPDTPQQPSQPPKGKILIFWGCGEHAPPGQPLVIDLSQLSDPTARTSMMAKMAPQPITLDTVHPPSPEHWKSYGEWPNAKSQTGLDANSSLLGAHVVKGNYSPDINFTVAQSQDFMSAIQIGGNTRDGSGAIPLQWQAISGARGIIITAMGSGGKGPDGGPIMVMWTSAQAQLGWGGLSAEYLTPRDEDRLLTSKVLLPGETTSCTVPAEVASPNGNQSAMLMYSMTAYGGESNFAYPPRPEDPKVPWNIQWETKVRYRSSTGGMLGRTMGAMAMNGGASASGASSSTTSAAATKKSSMLGDMLKQRFGAMMPGGGN